MFTFSFFCSLPDTLVIPHPKGPALDSACACGPRCHPVWSRVSCSGLSLSQTPPCTCGAAHLKLLLGTALRVIQIQDGSMIKNAFI